MDLLSLRQLYLILTRNFIIGLTVGLHFYGKNRSSQGCNSAGVERCFNPLRFLNIFLTLTSRAMSLPLRTERESHSLLWQGEVAVNDNKFFNSGLISAGTDL